MGLGLTICKNICEHMEGWIQYRANEVENGTIFSFGVPINLPNLSN